mmetsp:Transcript_14037/g.43520  ORF Transcript_14037/g.43520 Transcript_14037/m.43520 type:complete len:328 (-) Transcript_14037:2098-3081(-)
MLGLGLRLEDAGVFEVLRHDVRALEVARQRGERDFSRGGAPQRTDVDGVALVRGAVRPREVLEVHVRPDVADVRRLDALAAVAEPGRHRDVAGAVGRRRAREVDFEEPRVELRRLGQDVRVGLVDVGHAVARVRRVVDRQQVEVRVHHPPAVRADLVVRRRVERVRGSRLREDLVEQVERHEVLDVLPIEALVAVDVAEDGLARVARVVRPGRRARARAVDAREPPRLGGRVPETVRVRGEAAVPVVVARRHRVRARETRAGVVAGRADRDEASGRVQRHAAALRTARLGRRAPQAQIVALLRPRGAVERVEARAARVGVVARLAHQ